MNALWVLLYSGMTAGFCSGVWLFYRRHRVLGALAFSVRELSVSVIVPARDEEKNLPRLLDSLGRPSLRFFEVIVVDDGSQDRTSQVAESLGARVVRADPLPEGWTGKNWACHQGVLESRGEVLVFLDADTWFEKEGFQTALTAFLQRGSQPLSFLPWHRAVCLYEELSLFFNILMSIGVLGEGSLAGQSLWIKKEDYKVAGGHEAIRDEILENLFFASLLIQKGFLPTCFPGKNVISMRMYGEGLAALVQGWTKAFARGTRKVPKAKIVLSSLWISGLMMVFFSLVASSVLHLGWGTSLGLFYLLYAFQLYRVAGSLGSFRWLTSLVYPIPLLFFQWVFFLSHRKQRSGKRVHWRGRDVPAAHSS